MKHDRNRGILGLVVGLTAALAACSSSSSTAKSADTTAAKVASEKADALERLDRSTEVVTQLGEKVSGPARGRVQCVVAIPSMLKGGVVIGGQGGDGFATCKTSEGWSPPAPVTISGGTVGAQLGFQSTELLALVTTEKGTKALLSGNFNVGVDANATAGPVGTGRGAGTDVTSDSDMVSYSRSKGLFAGADLNGTAIKADGDAINALYGATDLSAILGGRVKSPEGDATQRFLSAVRAAFGGGRVAEHVRYRG